MRKALVLAGLIACPTFLPAVSYSQETQYIYRDYRHPGVDSRRPERFLNSEEVIGAKRSWFSRCSAMNEEPSYDQDGQLTVPGSAGRSGGMRTWSGGRQPSDCPGGEAEAGKIPDWSKNKETRERAATQPEIRDDTTGETLGGGSVQAIPGASPATR